MNCPNCQTYNPGDAMYCAQCGVVVPTQEQGMENWQERVSQAYLIAKNLSGILIDTLEIYKANFTVLLRIALIGHAPIIATAFVSNEAIVASMFVASLFTSLLATAATTNAVGRYYLGYRVTASICYAMVLNDGVSLLVNGLLFYTAVLLAMVLSFFIVGIPLLVFVATTYFFYVQIIAIERQGPMRAIVRSSQLVMGTWWRVFGIGCVYVTLLVAAGLLTSGAGRLIVENVNPTFGILLTTIAGVFVVPFGYVGATLVYFDLRVRKEDYDMETLASEIG